jgi:thiol:disulfide interchange protein
MICIPAGAARVFREFALSVDCYSAGRDEPAPFMSAPRPDAGPPAATRRKSPALVFAIVAAAAVFAAISLLRDRSRSADPGAGSVRWQSLSSVAASARSEKKPVLYDFTAAWCPPCHRLDREGWADSRIADLVNRGYSPARVVDREREDGKNSGEVSEVQRRYHVEAFPTLIVAGADGTEIARAEGYRGRDFLVRFLEENRTRR